MRLSVVIQMRQKRMIEARCKLFVGNIPNKCQQRNYGDEMMAGAISETTAATNERSRITALSTAATEVPDNNNWHSANMPFSLCVEQ